MTTLHEAALADMSEKDWQREVVDLAKRLGWKRPYHTHDSRRSEPGFPDLCLVRDRILWVELKRQTGKLTDAQIDWLTALHNADGEVYVARPADLQLLAQVLGRRYRIETELAKKTRIALGLEELEEAS